MKQQTRSFIPQAGERALIIGKTGSGKTAFAMFLLVRVSQTPIIIYDTKNESKFPKLRNSIIVYNLKGVQEQIDNPEIDYIIFRPPIEMLSKPLELDALLMHHYTHFHNVPAYIDELYSFHNNSRPGPGLVALYTRGRSAGITTIASTQRPRHISLFSITEAQKVYIFKLSHIDDRKAVGNVVPDFAKLPVPPKHGFYYFEDDGDSVELYKPIKLDPGLDTGYVDIVPADEGEGNIVKDNPATKHVWV